MFIFRTKKKKKKKKKNYKKDFNKYLKEGPDLKSRCRFTLFEPVMPGS